MFTPAVFRRTMIRGLALFVFLAAAHSSVDAATLTVEVRNTRGAPITDAIVYAIPQGKRVPPTTKRLAVMDQKNRMFVPHVLPIQTGTAVTFPNSDNVRHQVYSFSPARKFQLPLYAGTPAKPVVFDKPGVVALGCNIHDRMSAWIIVVDTSWFAVTVHGRAELTDLPEGAYTVHVWHESSRAAPAGQTVNVPSNGQELSFVVGQR